MTHLAPLPRRLIVSHGGKSHLTDGRGHLLCDPHRLVTHSQATLDSEPSCWWCQQAAHKPSPASSSPKPPSPRATPKAAPKTA